MYSEISKNKRKTWLLMLGFAAQRAMAANPSALTEAVLEVTLSDAEPGEMMVVLRDAQGRERELSGARGRESPKGLVAVFPDVEDRDAAEAMRGTDVYVPRSALPPASADEYYWVDLEGLRVVNLEGVEFGRVSHLFSTGANDVVVVHGERERMIPFLQPDYITAIDFDAGLMTVDWDADF